MKKCSCCGKIAKSGMMNEFDKKKRVICLDCMNYIDFEYGEVFPDKLIRYLKTRKKRRWWQFWKS